MHFIPTVRICGKIVIQRNYLDLLRTSMKAKLLYPLLLRLNTVVFIDQIMVEEQIPEIV